MQSCFSTTRLCFVGSDHSPLASHGGSGVAYIANWECHMKQMVIGASAFAALVLAAASACIEPSGLYDRSGTPSHAVAEFLVALALGPKRRRIAS